MRSVTSRVFVFLILTALCFSGSVTAQKKATGPVVVIVTSLGDIAVELDQQKAPKTVENFLGYVKEGFYRGTIFHRVMPDFMIQGGGFTPTLARKPTGPPIPNEAGNKLKNRRGTIAMARTADVNSATAQFFINVKDNTALDHKDNSPDGFGYAVFGRVIEGMGVVDKIAVTATSSRGGHNNVPIQPIFIKDVQVK